MTRDSYLNGPWRRWCVGHWAFFVLMQGMIAGLHRMVRAVDADRWEDADRLLGSLSELLTGSAAAMRFAADFGSDDYEATVRPTMEQPATVEGFSGLLSRDHRQLIKAVRAARPQLERARERLPERYEEFLTAHKAAMNAHIYVCARFGGDKSPSLRMNESSPRTSVDVLQDIKSARHKMIDVNPGRVGRN